MIPAATIRRIRAAEWLQLRTLRLQALADAPMAFGTTLADAERYGERFWQDAAAKGAADDDSSTFIADGPEGWLGMARGTLTGVDLQFERATASVNSVWVHPSVRGRGVAEALLRAVEDWATERGVTHLELYVTETNTPALALYFRLGFRPTGGTVPLTHTPSVRELELRAALPLLK